MENQIQSTATVHAVNFNIFIRSLVERFQPLKVFVYSKANLFLEYGGSFRNQKSVYACDYWLLVVTKTDTMIGNEIQEFANLHYKNGHVSIISHGEQSIAKAIKANNSFFIHVYATGQLIYNRDGLTKFDFRAKLNLDESIEATQHFFNQRIPIAEGFLRSALECLHKKDYLVTAFLLHQVVEQCCMIMIRVNIGYRTETHNLLRMLRLCNSFSGLPLKAMLTGSVEDYRLFNLLTKSYSESRYGSGFAVAEQDVQSLYQRVNQFMSLSKKICKRKIELLKHEAAVHPEACIPANQTLTSE